MTWFDNNVDTSKEIETKVTETKDDFIFTTVRKWMESEQEVEKTAVSKRILLRAMYFYMKEHADEYQMLSLECMNRLLEAEND